LKPTEVDSELFLYMSIDTLSNEQRYTKVAKSTTQTFKRLADQLTFKLGTNRRSEILGKIGNTGQPFEKIVNDYAQGL